MDKRIIRRGMEALVDIDEDLANAVEQVGFPTPRLRPVGFETLFATIISQQISTDAARAIRERVLTLMDGISPNSLLKVDPEALRSAGMSYRKIEYARGLAEAIVEGSLDLEGMRKQPDDDVFLTGPGPTRLPYLPAVSDPLPDGRSLPAVASQVR
jgi:DNA-3-methyladenine glycosylase II